MFGTYKCQENITVEINGKFVEVEMDQVGKSYKIKLEDNKSAYVFSQLGHNLGMTLSITDNP